MASADLEEAVAHYRDLAPRYDYRTRRINAVRERAIAGLALRPGEIVLDAGCGTGWCFTALSAAVGPQGRVIAFDPSPDMLAVARLRASTTPIDLLHATAEEVTLPTAPDAILFSYTHDLIRSRPALDNLFGQARKGARIAATSTKLYAPWLFPANWYLRLTHRGYITNFEGFGAPWSTLAEYLDDFRLETNGHTQHYVATGRLRG
ncbi:MAG: class I SAM-dependent methyltransferase [Usitatibacter sp.]